MIDWDLDTADHRVALRRQSLPVGSRWRHVRRDSESEIVEVAIREADGHPVAVYRCLETSRVWVRDAGEFLDGRFTRQNRDD